MSGLFWGGRLGGGGLFLFVFCFVWFCFVLVFFSWLKFYFLTLEKRIPIGCYVIAFHMEPGAVVLYFRSPYIIDSWHIGPIRNIKAKLVVKWFTDFRLMFCKWLRLVVAILDFSST